MLLEEYNISNRPSHAFSCYSHAFKCLLLCLHTRYEQKYTSWYNSPHWSNKKSHSSYETGLKNLEYKHFLFTFYLSFFPLLFLCEQVEYFSKAKFSTPPPNLPQTNHHLSCTGKFTDIKPHVNFYLRQVLLLWIKKKNIKS